MSFEKPSGQRLASEKVKKSHMRKVDDGDDFGISEVESEARIQSMVQENMQMENNEDVESEFLEKNQ